MSGITLGRGRAAVRRAGDINGGNGRGRRRGKGRRHTEGEMLGYSQAKHGESGGRPLNVSERREASGRVVFLAVPLLRVRCGRGANLGFAGGVEGQRAPGVGGVWGVGFRDPERPRRDGRLPAEKQRRMFVTSVTSVLMRGHGPFLILEALG